jgi:hypothetical protein
VFYVGQKVVCVDAFDTNDWAFQELFEGRIYTVIWVGSAISVKNGRSHCGVRVNGNFGRRGDIPFLASRFRPLVEKKTDIAVFTALLNPNGTKVDA